MKIEDEKLDEEKNMYMKKEYNNTSICILNHKSMEIRRFQKLYFS